ncbi:hypothetical protein [Nocardia thraciensis]
MDQLGSARRCCGYATGSTAFRRGRAGRIGDAGGLALDPNGFQLLAAKFGETVASFFGKSIGVK